MGREHSQGDLALELFDDPMRAQAGIRALEEAGFPSEEIGVLVRSDQVGRQVTEGTAVETGPDIGTPVEDLVGWLAGAAAYAIPGVGPVMSTGLFAIAFEAGVSGEGRGAVTGALVGYGLPIDEASRLEDAVREGQILVVAHAEGRGEDARRILRRE